MKTSLELFHLNAWKYPLPDDSEIVNYGTETLWYQWQFWTNVVSQLSRNLNEIPTDPLTDKKYIYSVAWNKNEFEILNLQEWDIALNNITQTNAANLIVTPRIDGTYNWVFIKTASYIVPVPSIITAEDISWWLTLTTDNIKSQIINWWDNIPNIWNVNYNTWALINLTLNATWTIDKNSTDAQKLSVYQAIYDTYTWTTLATDWVIQIILNQTTDEEKIAITKTVVLNNTTVASTTPTITETCTDWIQNQDETWVDCGWTCWACPITCPTWYVLVPNDWGFTTQDFCVAKYEMKNVWWVATSQATWTPWVSITQPNAITTCNNLWTWYHLITNNEWMTIARNIEANTQNWADWIVWSLVSNNWWLFRWNVNLNDAASCGSNIVLDWDTAWTNCDVSWRNKRMHILSNWNEIWDISWNVREHVNGTNNISSVDWVVADWNACSVTNWYSWNGINDGFASCTFTNATPTFYSKANHWPAWDYNANNWVWRIYSTTSTNRIFIRGGYWNFTTSAGVFALLLHSASANATTDLGFRCAFSVN